MAQLCLTQVLGMSVADFKRDYWGKKILHVKKALKETGEFFGRLDFERELRNHESKWIWNALNPHAKGLDKDYRNKKQDKIYALNSSQAKTLRDMDMYIFASDVQIGTKNIADYIVSIENALDSPSSTYDAMLFQSNSLGGHFMHNDTNEAFIMQLEGSRKWIIDSGPSKLKKSVFVTPEGQFLVVAGSDTNLVIEKEDMVHDLQELTLEAGDLLYVPAYTIHGTFKSECYSLSLSIFRHWRSVFDVVQQCIEFADEQMAEDLSSALTIHGTTTQIKAELLDRMKRACSYLESMDADYFTTIARQFSVGDFKSSLKIKAEEPVEEILDVSLSNVFCRNSLLCARVIENDISCSLHIDGQELEFEDKRWLPFLLRLEAGQPFSGQELLKECRLDGQANWQELKDYLKELLTLGLICRGTNEANASSIRKVS